MRAAGFEPKVYVGTSAGAVNATRLTAFAHLAPADQASRVLDQWRSMSVSEVYGSPLLALPGVTARLAGQTLRLPGVRLTHLLDTAPLRRKAHAAIDIR
jgi:NTE family protein